MTFSIILVILCIELIDNDGHRNGGNLANFAQNHRDALHVCKVVLQVSHLQILLPQQLVLFLLGEGQQMVVSDLSGVTHLVVLDLVQVYALGELVGLTESNHWHLVLTGQVADHRCSHRGDHAAISKHVTCFNEDLSCLLDERANSLN